jgi:hypothetical protein
MSRPSPAASPVRLPAFDYYGLALRLVKKVREGATVADVIATAEAYARDVRDIDCSYDAALLVGPLAVQIRKHCVIRDDVISRWREAARDFGSGQQFTDRKLANFLQKMYKEVHGAQVAEAAREAIAQSAKAKARGDKKKAERWRRVAANLEAMRQSITDGGFVPVPYPGKYQPLS